MPLNSYIVLLLLLAGTLARDESSLLNKTAHQFEFYSQSHKGIAHLFGEGPLGIEEALRDLAEHAEVPLAIEMLPQTGNDVTIPIEIDATNTTVGGVLAQIVLQAPRYVYRERLGLIEVLPVGSEVDTEDCLNMTLPTLHIDERWNDALQSLRCQINRVVNNEELLPDPLRGFGCPGGSFSVLSPAPAEIIKMNFESERVRDLLDKISVKAGNMAWTASFSGPRATCDSLSIHSYRPRRWYPSEGGSSQKWSEGLPQKCASCHYHHQ